MGSKLPREKLAGLVSDPELPPLAATRLHVVRDSDDTSEHLSFLRSLHNLSGGRAFCEVRPDIRNLHWLAHEILGALGKRRDVSGQVRNAQHAWRRALVWLHGEGIEQLFVGRAQLLGGGQWDSLIEAATQLDIELWLIVSGRELSRDQRERVRDIPMREWLFHEFKRFWREELDQGSSVDPARSRAKSARGGGAVRDTAEVQGEERVTAPSLALPTDDFPSFRAACRDLLEASDFGRVDEALRLAYRATRTWIEGQTTLSEETACEFLLSLIDDLPSPNDILIVLRGAQVAFFMSRWLLKVRPDRLQAGERDASFPEVAALAQTVRAYASSERAAATTLALVLRDTTLKQVAELDVGSVAEDGSTIQTGGGSTPIPAELRAPVLAQVATRLLDGALDNDPLFITEPKQKDGGPRPQVRIGRGLQRIVRQVASETGIRIGVRYSASRAPSNGQWQYRAGISLQKLKEPR